MTEKQTLKIKHLLEEIEKVEAKIDKLLTHRALLAQQIQKIRTEVPKEPVKPTEEQRKAQSEKDKAAYAARFNKNRLQVKRLILKD